MSYLRIKGLATVEVCIHQYPSEYQANSAELNTLI